MNGGGRHIAQMMSESSIGAMYEQRGTDFKKFVELLYERGLFSEELARLYGERIGVEKEYMEQVIEPYRSL